MNVRVKRERAFNPLHLSGYGVKITVQDLKHTSALRVTNGREDDRQSISYAFRPRRFPFSSIVVEGHSGYVSLDAFHWLAKNHIPLFMMRYDGTLISSLLSKSPTKPELRSAQWQAANDPKTCFPIARAFVQGKVARTIQTLDYLSELHDLTREVQTVAEQSLKLDSVTSVREARMVEAQIGNRYWWALARLLPKHLYFEGRHSGRMKNASDPVNSSLNYGYGLLEGECLKAISDVGLESTVGFLHNFTPQSHGHIKHALVYDLMEPYRWLVDLTVMEMFTSSQLDIRDFYFTGDDYRYRFEHDAKLRFIRNLVEHFKKRVSYDRELCSWSTVIQEKTRQLANHISDPARPIDFTEPSPILEKPMEAA